MAKTHRKTVNVINDHATKLELVVAWRVSNSDILKKTHRVEQTRNPLSIRFFPSESESNV